MAMTSIAPDQELPTSLPDDQQPSFKMDVDDVAEAWIDGAWTRVTLVRRAGTPGDRKWEVKELWGSQCHTLPLRLVQTLQEKDFPSSRLREGQLVCCSSSHGSSGFSELVSREKTKDRRKAWRVRFVNAGGEAVIPLEYIVLCD